MATKIPKATDAAPPSLGTHTQALCVGDLVFTNGLTGRDPKTGELADGLEAQTRQLLKNMEAILNAAGCTPADIVKVTWAMTDIEQFVPADHVYSAWLPGRDVAPYPVRTAFVVAGLPAGALIMIDVIAICPKG